MAWIRLRRHAARGSKVDVRIALTTEINTVVNCSVRCLTASWRRSARPCAKDRDRVRESDKCEDRIGGAVLCDMKSHEQLIVRMSWIKLDVRQIHGNHGEAMIPQRTPACNAT